MTKTTKANKILTNIPASKIITLFQNGNDRYCLKYSSLKYASLSFTSRFSPNLYPLTAPAKYSSSLSLLSLDLPRVTQPQSTNSSKASSASASEIFNS